MTAMLDSIRAVYVASSMTVSECRGAVQRLWSRGYSPAFLAAASSLLLCTAPVASVMSAASSLDGPAGRSERRRRRDSQNWAALTAHPMASSTAFWRKSAGSRARMSVVACSCVLWMEKRFSSMWSWESHVCVVTKDGHSVVPMCLTELLSSRLYDEGSDSPRVVSWA